MRPYHHAHTRTSRTTPQPAAQDPQNTPSRWRRDRSRLVFTASPDEVLGFIQPSATSERNLEDEVEAYLNTSPCPTDSCRNEPIPLESAGIHRNGQESAGMEPEWNRNGQEWTGMAQEWTKMYILELRV